METRSVECKIGEMSFTFTTDESRAPLILRAAEQLNALIHDKMVNSPLVQNRSQALALIALELLTRHFLAAEQDMQDNVTERLLTLQKRIEESQETL